MCRAKDTGKDYRIAIKDRGDPFAGVKFICRRGGGDKGKGLDRSVSTFGARRALGRRLASKRGIPSD